MIKLTSGDSIFDIKHLENLLKANGIECIIKNEHLVGGLGEIPFIECLPELWLIDDKKLKHSKEIISNAHKLHKKNVEWCCKKCNEINEYQFAICWKCEEENHE